MKNSTRKKKKESCTIEYDFYKMDRSFMYASKRDGKSNQWNKIFFNVFGDEIGDYFQIAFVHVTNL